MFFNQDFYRWLTNESFSNLQLNTYDDFYTGGIEKPHNKAIVKGNKREVFFKCQGNVGATTLGAKVSPFFGLREDSERR